MGGRGQNKKDAVGDMVMAALKQSGWTVGSTPGAGVAVPQSASAKAVSAVKTKHTIDASKLNDYWRDTVKLWAKRGGASDDVLNKISSGSKRVTVDLSAVGDGEDSELKKLGQRLGRKDIIAQADSIRDARIERKRKALEGNPYTDYSNGQLMRALHNNRVARSNATDAATIARLDEAHKQMRAAASFIIEFM